MKNQILKAVQECIDSSVSRSTVGNFRINRCSYAGGKWDGTIGFAVTHITEEQGFDHPFHSAEEVADHIVERSANEPRTNLSAILRRVAKYSQNGSRVTPERFGWGHSNVGSHYDGRLKNRLVALSVRYASYLEYVQEVLPQWTKVDNTYWADNSTDENQVDKDGNTRSVQLEGPHGDRCF